MICLLFAAGTAQLAANTGSGTLNLVTGQAGINQLTITVSANASGVTASDTKTSTVSGSITSSFDANPTTGATTAMTLTGGNIAMTDMRFVLKAFFGLVTVADISTANMGGTAYTPPPIPAPVTATASGGTFDAALHRLVINRGTMTGAITYTDPDTPINEDFAVSPVEGAGTGTGTVTMVPGTADSTHRTMQATIQMPVDFTDTQDMDGTLVSIRVRGTLKAAGPVRIPLAAPAGYELLVLDQDPYSFHRFSESSGTTAADTSGNNRLGTYVNSPTFDIPGAGGAGSDNAVDFNGTDQYMTVSNAASLGMLLKNLTFEAVFRTTTTSPSTLFGTWNQNNANAINFALNENATGANVLNTHRLFVRSSNSRGLHAVFTNSALRNGDYHHLMIALDMSLAQANRIKVYVNGVAQAVTVTNAGTALDGTNGTFTNFEYPLAVGARHNRATIDHRLDGVIDEFAIYDRTLSAADAAAHTAALVPPVLLSTVPADNATDVPIGANLVATFSKPVVAGTGNIDLWQSGGGSPVESFAVTSSTRLTFSGSTLTIDPNATLTPGVGYYVRIAPTAVVDTGGSAFAGISDPTAWSFTAENTFASWISNPAFGLAPADQGLNDDPDGDGIPNGVENFFGTNPGTFSQGLVAGTANPSAGIFTFTHPQHATPASDLTASYTWSKDLANFLADGATDGALTKVDFTTQPDTPSPGITTVTATVTGTTTSNLFVRVNVTQP